MNSNRDEIVNVTKLKKELMGVQFAAQQMQINLFDMLLAQNGDSVKRNMEKQI